MRGWFWNQWTLGGASWERVEIPVDQRPRISPEWLADERRVIGELKFRQEYLLEWVDDQSAVFSSELIKAAFTDTLPPLWTTPNLRVA
jgi:hypothetical protein